MPLDARVNALATRVAQEFNAREARTLALERRTLAGPLARVHGALAARERANTRVVFLGSSTTEGVGAGAHTTRYVNRLGRALQGAWPLATFDDEPPWLRLDAAAAAPPTRPGVQVINGGVGSTTAATYAPTATVTQIGTLNPLAVVHMIGSNDYAAGVAPATYQAQVGSVIAAIDAACATPPVHVLVHAYQRADVTAPTHPWTAYRDALVTLAKAAPATRLFVDLAGAYAAAGVPGADPHDLLGTDNVHQTDAGHAFMAALIADALQVPDPRPLPAPAIRDRFTRPDAATLGTSETGIAWEATTGAFAITSRKATVTTGGTHLIETGLVDVDISAVITPATGAVPGIVFRALDDSNRWGLFLNQGSGQAQLFRNDAGTNGAVAQVSVPVTAGREYRVRAVVIGDQIACYLDGAHLLTYTMSAADLTKFGGYTKCGLRLGSVAAGTTFDHFAVRSPIGDGLPVLAPPASSGGGSGAAPTNMVTTDTAQTITGAKTFDVPALAAEILRFREAGVTKALITDDGSYRALGGIHAGDIDLDGHFPTAMGSFSAPDPAIVALVARAAALQTADLMQFYDALGGLAARINAAGQFYEGGRRLAPVTSRLTAAATSTATAYAPTGLSVALDAGKVYRIRARGQYQTAATTTGIGFRLGGGAGLTAAGIRYEVLIYLGLTNAPTQVAVSTLNAAAATSTSNGSISSWPWTVEGLIRVDVGGNLTLDFRSEIAGSTVTVHPDSYLEAVEVA